MKNYISIKNKCFEISFILFDKSKYDKITYLS